MIFDQKTKRIASRLRLLKNKYELPEEVMRRMDTAAETIDELMKRITNDYVYKRKIVHLFIKHYEDKNQIFKNAIDEIKSNDYVFNEFKEFIVEAGLELTEKEVIDEIQSIKNNEKLIQHLLGLGE